MATSNITNTVTDPSGVAVGACRVVARLMPVPGFRISDSSEVARTVETLTNGSGLWTLALERNSNISPANTYYEVTEYVPVNRGGTRVWHCQVGASDQTLHAALVTSLPDVANANYLTQDSADARYAQLGTLSSATPANVELDGSASAGVSSLAARGDHEHVFVHPGKPIVRTYTANATWTKPTGLKYVKVRMVGGGGAGGGTGATTATTAAAGGGGGGGGYCEKWIAAADLGATETVTVGAGGTAAAAGVNTGGTGGTSSFGAHCSATGGGGGVGMAATNGTTATPGSPGAGSGGDINFHGHAGTFGHVITGSSQTVVSRQNVGGGSFLGGVARQTTSIPGSGTPNANSGAGSPGAQAGFSDVAQASKDGAAGLVIVEEFYI